MIKRFTVASLLVLAVAALVALPASQAKAKKKFGTSITIGYQSGNSTFSGKVNGKVKRCTKGRDVTLYAKPQGGDRMEAGTATTDAKGKYEISFPLLPGASYYAVAERKSTSSTLCLGARTGPIRSQMG